MNESNCSSNNVVVNCLVIDDDKLDKFQRMKRERINSVARIIKHRRVVDYQMFIAEMEVFNGIRPSVTRQYIRSLQLVGLVKVSNGKIEWNKKQES